MQSNAVVPYRPLHPGMGKAVAERTYLRKVLTDEAMSLLDADIKINPNDPDMRPWLVALHNTGGFDVTMDENAPMRGQEPPTRWEEWGEVAQRVATGNVSLLSLTDQDWSIEHTDAELAALQGHIATGRTLMSGRHLQQGDTHQTKRPMEVFCNCATSASSFALFYLLLNGAGVGRCYDDDMVLINWDHMPTVRVVLAEGHADFKFGQHTAVRDAQHLYGKGDSVHWFKVPDSREGWAEAIELMEVMAFQKAYKDDMLIIDFSDVRPEGAPIIGMQGRPSSGPVPLMNTIEKIAKIKGAGLKPWMQALYIDHFLAEPVLVGGARRAARMSTKHWSDPDILDFIEIKRPIEFEGMTMDEVQAYTADLDFPPMAFLWSSNNSVTVDKEFWRRAKLTEDHADYQSPLSVKARAVLKRVSECSYGDGTGEPGLINSDMLHDNRAGTDEGAYRSGDYVRSKRYTTKDETRIYLQRLAKAVRKKPNGYITNPCGEIALFVLGGFCVIADVVPFHADTLEQAEDAIRSTTRALIRVNLMDSLYNAEVARTNRIGVGLTGVHEFAWKFFNIGFNHLIHPDFEVWIEEYQGKDDSYCPGANHDNPCVRAAAFWNCLGKLSRASYLESRHYADELGVEPPHTVTTIKPSGSVSKLFGLTEGWHLPAMKRYMRWVQYRNGDSLVDTYRELGYPVRELKEYKGHTIVGFPTIPTITELEGIEEHIVTAGEASMDQQFLWLKLGEAFWLEGHDPASFQADMKTLEPYGNQISYTLKYKPSDTPYEEFARTIAHHQPEVRCVSVMPQVDDMGAYEYLPEQSVSKAEFEGIARAISKSGDISEDINKVHIDCDGGACPVEFNEEK